jgi:hypothetical protein
MSRIGNSQIKHATPKNDRQYSTYGMIVIFQRSEEYKVAVDAALLLYSNGGTNVEREMKE